MHRLPHRARKALVHRLVESRRLRGRGEVLTGHHNINYVRRSGLVLALLLGAVPYTRFKYRVPLRTAVEVVPRIWPREADVLGVVCRYLREVPPCLADLGDGSVHRYRMGRALSDSGPQGRVDEELLRSFAAFFVRTARVPVAELPPRPEGWPLDGDTQGFLEWLVSFTERRVHRPNRDRFGALFDAVGIPEDAMARFAAQHRCVTSRPFRLLHTDVHRANVVVRGGPGRRLAVIDWELAILGDPLHDLATHLVRMAYGKEEQARMVELWAEAMEGAGFTDLTAGLHEDLPVYVAFEYAQSVFPDVMRAAVDLPGDAGAEHFRAAADRVERAMGRAREPLRLVDVPHREQITEALRRWHRASR
ncbi:phosphotransferase family protein [Streptomyces sp. NRRL F-5650]|uniref:phosphotransferase family protein n=1 Tax=Streptomyces sp. NRRL F-5650 TaxID=1463868 RepID=UPI0004C4F3F6|nr:phosphotransferase [Streptomyces sp. NRRL F-5650]